jgi:PIN domain nuclease of toxin-antitoxin system
VTLTLLDTHAWLWWVSEPHHLGSGARDRIAAAERDGAVCVSAISAWEVAMLVAKARLELTMSVDDLVATCERLPVMRFLPITARIAAASADLVNLHPDPADRFIVATARAHNAVLVTKDARLHAYEGIRAVW